MHPTKPFLKIWTKGVAYPASQGDMLGLGMELGYNRRTLQEFTLIRVYPARQAEGDMSVLLPS